MYPPYNFRSKYSLFNQDPDPYSTPYSGDLFGEQNIEQQNPYNNNPQPPAQPRMDFGSAYAELMNRQGEGENFKRYSDFVKAGPPNEADYKPSKLRRLGAILSGAALGYNDPREGINTAAAINEAPYRKALERNKMQGGYLKEAADIENTGFGRQLATVKAMQEMEHQHKTDERLDRAEQSTEAYRKIQTENINSQIAARKSTGYTVRLNEDTGEVVAYKILPDGTIDKKVISKDLSAVDKANLDVTKAGEIAKITDPIISNRQKLLQAAGFAHADASQKRTFEQQDKTRKGNEDFQRQQQIDREDAIDRRSQERAKKPQTITEANNKNATTLEALIHANPNKYKDLYTRDSNGAVILGDNPGKDNPQYIAYKELFDALYNGISGIEPLAPLFTIKKK